MAQECLYKALLREGLCINTLEREWLPTGASTNHHWSIPFLGRPLLYHYYRGTTDLQISLTTQFSERRQIFLWIAFFASFAVKVPMVPVHIWLPEAHVEAPTAGSIILAGIPLKLGTYGFLRFSIPMFPEATLCSTPFIYTSSAIAIIYTSSTTLRQIDLKKIIAYSSVAHMNLVTIGMFSRAAAVRSPILSYGHTRPKHVCPGMRPINLLAMGEKT
ncbi:hypothetical protein ACH5RR_023672 [Cinchona calisaya]|uniref:NADH-ubiquinone oxidoreductase chain 4 n=1 Tax=Cinchona calisaya TaxID=153742 RepID=A0ABD2ZBB6_9GENT